MQPSQRIAALLIYPFIAWLGVACERTDTPTEARPKALLAQFSQPVDLVVDDDGFASTTDCDDPFTTAYPTIQDAVNAASALQTIGVCPGTYPEAAPVPLKIDKTLTLLGAQSGVDARSRVGQESIVSDLYGTWVAADNVVIDGFTIENSTNSYTGYGIWMGGKSGTHILNNIIQNNIVGIGLSNRPGGSQVIIRHNQIQNNNQLGSASGTGIYTDQYVSLGAVRNVLIEENAFIGNADAGIDVSNTDPANGVSGLDVSTNSFNGDGRGLVLFNTHMSTIHDNSITNSTSVGSAAIRLFDNNSRISILNNDLMTGAGHAIRLSLGALNLPSSDVVIHENNIGVSGPTSFLLDGLLVSPGSHTGTVNAECNWWGSPTGPTDPTNNPSGTGEEVVGNADYTPWLLTPAPGGACVGGVPSTPGKATGGGQIEGDPLFAVDGVLLSLPALVPSLADPKSQASFGFVVKQIEGGGTPTGNLEYNDKPGDVRIKAASFSGLFISSPGTLCPTIPTSKHAKFTGTAAVIRSTGTTTESFTVDVDDCGEPGTGDSFGIKTTSYMNGPSTLIGGNIQIH